MDGERGKLHGAYLRKGVTKPGRLVAGLYRSLTWRLIGLGEARGNTAIVGRLPLNIMAIRRRMRMRAPIAPASELEDRAPIGKGDQDAYR